MSLKNTGPLKVLINAPLSRYSGYGSDGIDMVDALIRKGIDVYLQPTGVQAPLPQSVANILTKNLTAPFDVIINHVDPMVLGSSPEQVQASDIRVAWSMWEFTTLDNMKRRSSLRKRLKDFNLFFGYSDVSVEAFRPYTPKNVTLATLQGGYKAELWPYVERDWDSPRFSFIMNGQLTERKGVWCAIAAFQELKDQYPEEFEPAEFHLHNTVPTIPDIIENAIPKLRLHYRTFDDKEMHDFYQSGHVLLAPSRGEGKNLPALEMLSTGGSVIYTDWGGHQNWGSDHYAYPLKHTLTPLDAIRVSPNCLWADPDKDHLKEIMLHCFRNRAEVKAKGVAGSNTIPRMCSWDRVMDDFFRRLGELVPGSGEEVSAKYNEAVRIHELKKGVRRG